jgi:hypothetical protein
MVGALLANLTPEDEQARINKCAKDGWELVHVVPRKHAGNDYVFLYFRRIRENESEGNPPRFNSSLFAA